MFHRKFTASFCLICILLCTLSAASTPLPAFPGAFGFGSTASGGRGGDVYHVTTLNDSGEGSLRYGLENTTGPRTIVFDVSGNIALQSDLTIQNTALTIAGQTAPGDGITLYGYPVTISGKNIILRYVRFRCGDYNAMEDGGLPSKGNGDLKANTAGALDVHSADTVIIDHISTSWSMDEVLSVTYSNNVTVQNSIISEALNESYHEKGAHGFGSLIRGNGEGGITFIRNLYAHNNGRNPGTGSNQTTLTIKLQFDFINNVIYGWGNRSGEAIDGSKAETTVEINYRGNYAIANSSSRNKETLWDEYKNQQMSIYQEGNLLDNDLDGVRNGTNKEWELFPGFEDEFKIASPYKFPEVPIVSADSAYKYVISNVGASLNRDAVDMRVINDVINCTGTLINSQDEVGGLPELKSLTAPVDSDLDGMPDSWEIANGLNSSDPNDRNDDKDNDGYTNLEEYLHECTITKVQAGTINKKNQRTITQPGSLTRVSYSPSQLTVTFCPQVNGHYRFSIHSLDGRVNLRQSRQINGNENQTIQFEYTNKFESGMYFLLVQKDRAPDSALIQKIILVD